MTRPSFHLSIHAVRFELEGRSSLQHCGVVQCSAVQEYRAMGCCESTPARCSEPETQERQIEQPQPREGQIQEPAEGIGPVIYVENLPRNIFISRLEKEFSKFGNIKPGKIQLRNEGSSGSAFIEFESRNSVAKAIQGSPLSISDQLVFVRA